jgi:hypothetical protein
MWFAEDAISFVATRGLHFGLLAMGVLMDEYLWPARQVAEYAYCPRLFYLMEVEGVYLPSSDTEQGMAVHRRVNKPSAASDSDDSEQDNDRPQAVRSLTLTSQRLNPMFDRHNLLG